MSLRQRIQTNIEILKQLTALRADSLQLADTAFCFPGEAQAYRADQAEGGL